MSFYNTRLEVYDSLTVDRSSGEAIQPNLRLEMEDEIMHWSIDSKQSATEDLFEIYGRRAKIEFFRDSPLGKWLKTKRQSTIYPEYYDAAFRLYNADTGEAVFTGALPIEHVKHTWNDDTVEITIVDALHIWITQSRKHTHQFGNNVAENYWYLEDDEEYDRTLAKLMDYPVSELALGMNTHTINITAPELGVVDYSVVFDHYRDDLYSWENNWNGPILDDSSVIYKKYLWYVVFDESELKYKVALAYIFRANNTYIPPWIVRHVRFEFDYDNLFYPSFELAEGPYGDWIHTSVRYRTASQVRDHLRNLVFPGQTIGGVDHHIEATLPHTASYTSEDGWFSSITVEEKDDGTVPILVTYTGTFNKMHFKSGSRTYEAIAHSLITMNALMVTADEYGIKHITNSALNPGIDINAPGALIIPDDTIIDQQRDGTLADAARSFTRLSVFIGHEVMQEAILRHYRGMIKRIACRLSFSLPDSYYNQLDIFQLISIDGYNYIVTSISYPEDGFIDVQAVGEWN